MKTAGLKRMRWTANRYFRLSELGFFANRRVELLNGDIIQVPPQAAPHRAAVTNTSALLLPAFHGSAWVVIRER